VIHSGYNPDTGAYVLLLDAGTDNGLAEGAEYAVAAAGRETGSLVITAALPGSAVGTFNPLGGEAPPPPGADVTLTPRRAYKPLAIPDAAPRTGTASPSATAAPERSDAAHLKKIYRVGPGDVLGIEAFPEGVLPEKVTVRPDGAISLPYAGYIDVRGLNVFQIADTVTKLLSRDFKQPWVEVTVLEYKSASVKIIGEVNTTTWRASGAGEYPLIGETGILEFITTIGGLTNFADAAGIKVTHADGSQTPVDLNRAIADPLGADNIALRNGDLIFVPRLPAPPKIRVIALGRLARQGVIELESDKTGLIDLLSAAGGIQSDAAYDRVQIVRGVGPAQQAQQVNFSGLGSGKPEQDINLLDGDIVYVPSKTEKKTTLDRINKVLKDVLPTINFLWLQDRLVD